MTRKRFIKLMMRDGVSMNYANALADNISQYGSYESAYRCFYYLYAQKRLEKAINQLKNAVVASISPIRRLAECIISQYAARLPRE